MDQKLDDLQLMIQLNQIVQRTSKLEQRINHVVDNIKYESEGSDQIDNQYKKVIKLNEYLKNKFSTPFDAELLDRVKKNRKA